MPWYIAFALFLLSPVYSKWAASVWPKLEDWWASRSRSKTQQRIKNLHALLAWSEKLQPLTDFENAILSGLIGIVFLLSEIPTVVFLAYMIISGKVTIGWVSPRDSLPYFVAMVLAILFSLIGLNIQRSFITFQRLRSPRYQRSLIKQAEQLIKQLDSSVP